MSPDDVCISGYTWPCAVLMAKCCTATASVFFGLPLNLSPAEMLKVGQQSRTCDDCCPGCPAGWFLKKLLSLLSGEGHQLYYQRCMADQYQRQHQQRSPDVLLDAGIWLYCLQQQPGAVLAAATCYPVFNDSPATSSNVMPCTCQVVLSAT